MNRIISLLASSFILLITLLNFYNYLTRQNSLYIRESSDEATAYWRNMINQYPTFKDAYIALAQIEKDKGNVEAARVLMEEAKRLSPNEDLTQISLR